MRARALSGEAARREKRGRQPEKKKERLPAKPDAMPLPSRAFNQARGRLRVSGVLLDGPRKERDCS